MGKISSYTVTDDALTDVLLGDTSAPATVRFNKDRLLAFADPAICNGRLTTETGVAISTSDRTAQGTLYFTNYLGNRVSLFDGTRWRLYTFTERSLSLTVTSGKNYDVFLYDNAGTLTLELSAAWTTDTGRADALALQDGISCKSGALTRRWIGTIRASGSNTIEDSLVKRYVWNTYNQISRRLSKQDATAHDYGTASWRAWNNDTAVRVEWVQGLAGLGASVGFVVRFDPISTGAQQIVGIGLDSASGDAVSGVGIVRNVTAVAAHWIGGGGSWAPGLGYHFAQADEYGIASGGVNSLVQVDFSVQINN